MCQFIIQVVLDNLDNKFILFLKFMKFEKVYEKNLFCINMFLVWSQNLSSAQALNVLSVDSRAREYKQFYK